MVKNPPKIRPRRGVHQHEKVDPEQLPTDRYERGDRGLHDLDHQQQRNAEAQPFLGRKALPESLEARLTNLVGHEEDTEGEIGDKQSGQDDQ